MTHMPAHKRTIAMLCVEERTAGTTANSTSKQQKKMCGMRYRRSWTGGSGRTLRSCGRRSCERTRSGHRMCSRRWWVAGMVLHEATSYYSHLA